MTREEARQYWQFRLDNAKDYIDLHWEADERRAHREYVEALTAAIEALSADRPTHERDLISRHEALIELNGACEMWEDDAIVADIIHKLPSIEIVRCKDCYHYGIGNCYMYGGQMNEDDFCSRAERKDK